MTQNCLAMYETLWVVTKEISLIGWWSVLFKRSINLLFWSDRRYTMSLSTIIDVLRRICFVTRMFLPLDFGDITWYSTEAAPALSPIIVTLFGSPPNLAMLRCTHCRAKFWSFRPWLPDASGTPIAKNPTRTRKKFFGLHSSIDLRINSRDYDVLWIPKGPTR